MHVLCTSVTLKYSLSLFQMRHFVEGQLLCLMLKILSFVNFVFAVVTVIRIIRQ